jgi:outer membrane protein TolC
LSLQDAVTAAMDSRPSLKAEAENVAVAEGRKQQAGLWPNPEVEFSNQNLRPGQTYSRDVDTYLFATQPLEVFGKRQQRVAVAEQAIARSKAEYELARRQVAHDVALAYWTARGAQERRDVLAATVAAFQQTIDYHVARLSVGAIAEQDVLRVRLEGERLQVSARLAVIGADKARLQLLRSMGRPDWTDVVLTEPIDTAPTERATLALDQVLSGRAEVQVARATLAESQTNERLQAVLARPDLAVSLGYKRTQLPDATTGVNTALAGITVTVPILDRRQGERAAAAAEVRRQTHLIAAAERDVRSDVELARQEFEMRRTEVTATLQPLREHAQSIADIARAAYAQSGIDLLRLLDAERLRLDADLAWVDEMVAFQQSRVNLDAAEGVSR